MCLTWSWVSKVRRKTYKAKLDLVEIYKQEKLELQDIGGDKLITKGKTCIK